MDNRWKNAIYSVILLIAMFVVWKWRNAETPTEPIKIEGETMATTYRITYFDPQQRNFKKEVDSLFVLVNQSINNYNPHSEVSIFNKSTGFRFKLPYLYPPYHLPPIALLYRRFSLLVISLAVTTFQSPLPRFTNTTRI